MKIHHLIKGLFFFTSLFVYGAKAGITYDIVVAADGSGNYKTVQEAFDAVSQNSSNRTVIYIKNGTYTEKLVLDKTRQNVTIIGQSRDSVKLTYNDYSGKIVDGDTLGTSTSRSTYIAASGFCAINITFENSSGPVGQALAIYIGGDKAIFYNCDFLGRQDTWYAGNCRQFIRKCYIEGTTDFMFGPSTAWIDSCEIYTYGGSALTAASTAQYVTYGYVFRYCTISGASGVSTALGRPWRPYAAVSFLNCSMTSCIKSAGWDNWGDTANESTARYSEYNNTGDGASTSGRVSWATQLTASEAAKYTISNVLSTTYADPPVIDNWDPLTTLSLYISGYTGTLENPNSCLSVNSGLSILQSTGQFGTLEISGVVSTAPVSLSLLDLRGRVVYNGITEGNKKVSFKLNRLTTGTYLTRVENGGHIICKNVMIH